jgi:hypothetical protein
VTVDPSRLAVGLDPELASDVQHSRLINAEPAPFLAHGRIWEVMYGSSSHPAFVTLGQLEGGPTTVLSSPAVFVDFARKAGLVLDDDVRRTEYVKTFLSMGSRYVLVEALSSMYFMKGPDEPYVTGKEEILKIDPGSRTELEKEYAKLRDVRRQIRERAAAIKPLCLRGTGSFRGTVHAMAGFALVRLDLTLDPSGAVAIHEEVLVTGLPLPVVTH